MKKTFTFLLMVLILGLCTALKAQTALDPNQFVNTQITADGVYTMEAGGFYAFDGRLDLVHDVTIQGPSEDWIRDQANPPVILQTPGADGSQRQFMQINEGGKLTLENVILSGTHSNDEVCRVMINNTGGSGFVVDNCVITDWTDFALRNQNSEAESISVTNTVFINGVRVSYSQWGGFPIRMDSAPDEVIWENNTIVNCGRLLANAGPFEEATIHQTHNTVVNQIVAGEEHRGNEIIQANNIFYNYHFIGYATENHSAPSDNYATYWTGLNVFSPLANALDHISLYVGQNLFYRPQEVVDWFETKSGDSIALSKLWEFAEVDSFILADDNYRIGANYADIDPGFASVPDNIGTIVENINLHYNRTPDDNWIDWRIPSPVTFDANSAPSLSNWPPAFDLSYSNSGLQTAGTDGLPLGDLNWFPEKKAEYLANRDAFIADIRDSMLNAQLFYDPETMDNTPLITELSSSVKELRDPSQLNSAGNFPNPFTDITTIKFGIKQQSDVTLSVYDLVGKKIYESSQDGLAPGSYVFNFNGANLSSGTYFYKINAVGKNGQNYVASKKMILSK
ncbi:T9SS type A sorting domain-containing protein [Portibacter lacus]|uniref:Secretion system C-terminal sorting domain-containing protein n=1 Tax=Portibacter lacus TaxID=1099794 RepID=A0AA37SN61_9BACT|nr:T9SS type A sorting domain-containing protein [Portibacter lacus]GLR17903.1 hypothetical protein GCM10007940_25180 [Portibacter lacus]